MAEGYGALRESTRRVLTVPQDQIAAMLSLSRQTANQILKEFEARGAVRLRYGGIELLDLALLRTSLTAGTPAKLFTIWGNALTVRGRPYDVARDGTRFLTIRAPAAPIRMASERSSCSWCATPARSGRSSCRRHCRTPST